ncbi:phosphotransferase [Plantactinospora sp. CA-290183]|uniref:phosphotransferase n=1 Tax=Plantactinospora sp. CA-290183 TaxID=3240006 RepID=UPI003D8B4CFE
MSPAASASVAPGPPSKLAALGLIYAWGALHDITYLPTGLMTRNWRIVTDAGVHALKELRDASPSTARRNLRVLARLIDLGVPGCRPRMTRNGDSVAEIDQTGFMMTSWLDGHHLRGRDLTLDQAHELGRVIARLHDSLRHLGTTEGLPAPPEQLRAQVTETEAAVAKADHYLAAAEAGNTPFDTQVTEILHRRKLLINKVADERPRTHVPAGPHGWIHGDLQHRNILWAPTVGHDHNILRVAGILDWDRIRIRPFGEELVRTATIQFGSERGALDLVRINAFTRGYRTILPLDDNEVTDAVERLWWKRLTDYWHLDFHYDRGDTSCDDLFLSGEETLHWWTNRRDEVKQAFTSCRFSSPMTDSHDLGSRVGGSAMVTRIDGRGA